MFHFLDNNSINCTYMYKNAASFRFPITCIAYLFLLLNNAIVFGIGDDDDDNDHNNNKNSSNRGYILIFPFSKRKS